MTCNYMLHMYFICLYFFFDYLMYISHKHLWTLAGVDDSGHYKDDLSDLISFPKHVFHVDSDSDRVKAKLGQKCFQIY